MPSRLAWLPCLLTIAALPVFAGAEQPDPDRDILITYVNAAPRVTTSGRPYRHRKRYAISHEARRLAVDVADEYGLRQIDHWPIRSLSIYCFVYRIPDGADRALVIERIKADRRVDSVQALNEFTAETALPAAYDDTYVELQHGLDTLDLSSAHRVSRGQGVRVAVIDSSADDKHEDLRGRIRTIGDFAGTGTAADRVHGTAVTSVIAARANNAIGIVGVAPEASVELYVACWSRPRSRSAICDSFTLAKALDEVLERPPQVLNLSLMGPADPLLRRLLLRAFEQGVIIVAARPDDDAPARGFPASMQEVIGVGSSHAVAAESPVAIFAPGEQILVAIPDNAYDFQSGSSLAAAHVSGVVALLLAVRPGSPFMDVQSLLRRSQLRHEAGPPSVNACKALALADSSLSCEG